MKSWIITLHRSSLWIYFTSLITYLPFLVLKHCLPCWLWFLHFIIFNPQFCLQLTLLKPLVNPTAKLPVLKWKHHRHTLQHSPSAQTWRNRNMWKCIYILFLGQPSLYLLHVMCTSIEPVVTLIFTVWVCVGIEAAFLQFMCSINVSSGKTLQNVIVDAVCHNSKHIVPHCQPTWIWCKSASEFVERGWNGHQYGSYTEYWHALTWRKKKIGAECWKHYCQLSNLRKGCFLCVPI